EILTHLAGQGLTKTHPLFEDRPIKSRLIIVIAGDKGLAGAYNTNVVKLYLKELGYDSQKGIKNQTLAIGRRATQFATRLKDVELVGVYENLPDKPSGRDLFSILDLARDKFLDKQVDAVDLIYTEFKNSLIQ